MNKVQFPEMRNELIESLRGLSDIEYQKRIWINARSEGSIQHDEFDYVVHFLFDDTSLATDPDSLIGVILKNFDEVAIIKPVIEALGELFDALGLDRTDEEYVKSTEWSSVVNAAKIAYAKISANN